MPGIGSLIREIDVKISEILSSAHVCHVLSVECKSNIGMGTLNSTSILNPILGAEIRFEGSNKKHN